MKNSVSQIATVQTIDWCNPFGNHTLESQITQKHLHNAQVHPVASEGTPQF